MPGMQAVSAPPPPPAQADPRLQKGPLYIMAPGLGLLAGSTQHVHQQQVKRCETLCMSVYSPCPATALLVEHSRTETVFVGGPEQSAGHTSDNCAFSTR